MKYEINGQVVEAEGELSEADIDEIAASLQANSPKFYELEKQPGMNLPEQGQGFLKDAGNLALHAAKQFGKQVASPMPFSTLTAPIRIAQENAAGLGSDVARGLMNTGLNAPAARAGGFIASAVTDPTSYMGASLLKSPGMAKSLPQNAMRPNVQDMIDNLVKQKSPLKEEIETQTARIMDSLDNTVKEYGAKLNTAKAKIGIPVTVADKEKSILQYGNAHGLGKDKINKMYQDIIEETKDSTKLAQNVTKFKQMASHITDPKLKAQLASVLQDNINKVVDWTKTGDSTEGVLKKQYADLKELALPEALKESKKLMSDALNLADELGSKLDDPGKAEAFIRSTVLGKSARTKDFMNSLRHLEEVSGVKFFDDIKKAIVTEKSAEAAIKQLEKLKPANKINPENTNVLQDILKFKMSGWTVVIEKLIQYKDSIKRGAKSVGKHTPAQAGIGLTRLGEGSNKRELDKALSRLKNAY